MMPYFLQRSDRLVYRKAATGDVSSWAAFFINNDRLHFMGIPLTGTPEELAAWWVNKQKERYQDSGFGHLAATLPESGALIGMAGIIPRHLEGEVLYEVGYSLLPAHWGKGYGTEMAQQMKAWAFQHLPVDQVISIIHKDNTASQHVARKNGLSPWKEAEFKGMPVVVYRVLREG